MVADNEVAEMPLAIPGSRVLAVPHIDDVKRDLDAVDQFKKIVHEKMDDGVDYGKIPGTPKPTLYQPGAQKVCELMKLRPRFEAVRIVEDWDRPLFHYVYRCVLVHIPSGYEVSECIGSCNSLESKYRWRYIDKKCPACGAEAIRKSNPEYGDGWYCNRRAGGCGQNFRKGDPTIEQQTAGKVPNDDIFSQINTIDKMSQKRSLVGAALFIGRLSDVFTQDLEDMDQRSIPVDERSVEDGPVTIISQPANSNGSQRTNGSRADSRGQGKCAKHGKQWAKAAGGRIGHPQGDGWCWREEAKENEAAAPPEDDLVERLGRRLKEEGIQWIPFFRLLGVKDWRDWQAKFAGDGISEDEARKAAVTAAWHLYEEDKEQRSKGCLKCGNAADVLGNVWCRSCIDADEQAHSNDGNERPVYDEDGNRVYPQSEPASPDPDVEEQGDLPF